MKVVLSLTQERVIRRRLRELDRIVPVDLVGELGIADAQEFIECLCRVHRL